MTGDHDASTTPSAANRVRVHHHSDRTTPCARTLRRALSDWELDAWFTLSVTQQLTRDELEADHDAEANP